MEVRKLDRTDSRIYGWIINTDCKVSAIRNYRVCFHNQYNFKLFPPCRWWDSNWLSYWVVLRYHSYEIHGSLECLFGVDCLGIDLPRFLFLFTWSNQCPIRIPIVFVVFPRNVLEFFCLKCWGNTVRTLDIPYASNLIGKTPIGTVHKAVPS